MMTRQDRRKDARGTRDRQAAAQPLIPRAGWTIGRLVLADGRLSG